tara:strand:- start:47 stop:763 length:717 start_codon:yes stop_codon:yes gene_type:complete
LYFKAAYSPQWSSNIVKIAEENNGKVIPLFKWSFNGSFYKNVFGNEQLINEKFSDVKKEYDIGYFCNLEPYTYPKPSAKNPLISWSDHKKFDLPGESKNMGHYLNNSRELLYNRVQDSSFKVLHRDKMNYYDYIRESYKCKVILNPPGVGEYTSRMFDQSYLGNCVVLRKSSYDNGISWKNHLPEVDFNSKNWQSDMKNIVDNYQEYGKKCKDYFDSSWSAEAIVNYLDENIKNYNPE